MTDLPELADAATREKYISAIEAAVERHCEPHDGYPDMDDIYDSVAPLIAEEVAAALEEAAENILHKQHPFSIQQALKTRAAAIRLAATPKAVRS